MASSRDLRSRLGHEVLLLDGGLGTQLMAAGLEHGCAPERWNIEHGQRVEAAHAAYVAAGSDIIHTNTFGGTPHKLEASGQPKGACAAVNGAAVAIAKRAAQGRALVAGDVGPCGLMLSPMGTASEAQLRGEFEVQIRALCEAGVDLIAIETMFDLRECRAAVKAARDVTSLPVFASMTFEAKRRGAFTMVGDPLLASLKELEEAGADAVGCNCSVTPEGMLPMLKAAAASLRGPLIAQPNAGQPRSPLEGGGYALDAGAFVRTLEMIVDAGAMVIGGCCGTDPALIARLRTMLDGRRS